MEAYYVMLSSRVRNGVYYIALLNDSEAILTEATKQNQEQL